MESFANWATIISCVLEVVLFGFVLFEFKYLRYEAKSSYDFEMEQKIEYLCYTVNENLKKEIGKLKDKNKYNTIFVNKQISPEKLEDCFKKIYEIYHIPIEFSKNYIRYLNELSPKRRPISKKLLHEMWEICSEHNSQEGYLGPHESEVLRRKYFKSDKEIKKIYNYIRDLPNNLRP